MFIQNKNAPTHFFIFVTKFSDGQTILCFIRVFQIDLKDPGFMFMSQFYCSLVSLRANYYLRFEVLCSLLSLCTVSQLLYKNVCADIQTDGRPRANLNLKLGHKNVLAKKGMITDDNLRKITRISEDIDRRYSKSPDRAVRSSAIV